MVARGRQSVRDHAPARGIGPTPTSRARVPGSTSPQPDPLRAPTAAIAGVDPAAVRASTDRRTAHAPPWADAVEAVVRSPGHALDPATRRAAEAQLHHDLSSVRIHHDRTAAASARSIGARAYSIGPHIVFAEGRHAPATAQGRELLLHELAHVVQRGPGAPMPGGPLTIGPADSVHERAARSAARHGLSDSLHRGPRLPAEMIARDAEEENAVFNRAYAASKGLPEPGPGDSPTRVKDSQFTAPHTSGASGLTAREFTMKATAYPGSERAAAEDLGADGLVIAPRVAGGYVRSVEATTSEATKASGDQANVKHIYADKTFHGVTLGHKQRHELPSGVMAKVGTQVDAEVAIGRSEKTTYARVHNSAATSETSTHKTFEGRKTTLNAVDYRGDFREIEDIVGEERRSSIGAVTYRDSKGREVASERNYRVVTTDGRSQINLRNTGTKYQALDLDRIEVLSGRHGKEPARRTEATGREVMHADGTRQRDTSTVSNRGTVTTREASRRLAGGREERNTTQSSSGTQTSVKRSETARDGGSTGYATKVSADASRGYRSNTSYTRNVPGASPIAPRVQQGSTVVGGKLGLITPSPTVDPRAVVVGDRQRFDNPANQNVPGSYVESLDVHGTRVQKKDEYEVTDRGVSAGVSVEAEKGILHNFLRKDRFNLGWLVVENAINDYYLAGVQGKTAAGVKAGIDQNNINASASGSAGFTRRLSNELTVRLGGFFAKLKAEADAFAGIEAAISLEGGHTRGAGLGGGVNASAFAGARAGLGGRLEGGFQGVSFAAGAYKLRGSLGAGFKANFEARVQNGHVLLAGGLALSAEVGLGADVEVRINPTAVGAAVLKGAIGANNVETAVDLAKKAYGAAGAAKDRVERTASSAVSGARSALGRLRRVFD
jgi:hypothetical protein